MASFFVIGPLRQISAGELFELLRPAAWVLSIFVSACVLADTQRRRLSSYGAASWPVTTLLLPLIVLPIYLITRRASSGINGPIADGETATVKKPSRLRIILLPLLYASLLLSAEALAFHLENRTADAHLARASQARLLGQQERTIREYRAALQLEEDAHTHNLLATELAGALRWDEALEELRAAERGGDPDDTIPYRMAMALDTLGRREEAAQEYVRFLDTPLCKQVFVDARCNSTRLRLQALMMK